MLTRQGLTPEDFGAVGDWNGSTGTNDLTAFRNLFLAIQARGGGAIDLGSKRYKLSVGGGDSAVADFSDLRGLTIKSDGAELVLDGTYTGSQALEVLKFTDCVGVRLRGLLTFTCTQTQPAGQATSRGPDCFKFMDGCDGVDLDHVVATNCRSAVVFRRNDFGDPKAKNTRIGKITATDVGYAFNCIINGDNVEIGCIESLRAGRSYYVYGVSNHRVRVRSQDPFGQYDCLIASSVGNGCEGIHVDYTNIESTVADASINGIGISFSDQTATVHRDIRCHVNVSAATSSDYIGHAVIVEKINNAGSADTVDRGHTLDGLTISGVIVGKNANHRNIAVCAVGTWGSGESLYNIRLTDLRMNADGQAYINLASLKDVALLDNVYSKVSIDITGNSSSRIVMVACNVPGFVSGTANIDRICTRVNGVLFNTAGQNVTTVAYSASMTIDASSGNEHTITDTNNVAFTINAPTNPTLGQRITITLRNTSGGALGAATWNAIFKMSAWTNPADGNSRSIDFRYDGTNWVQIGQTGVDVPN